MGFCDRCCYVGWYRGNGVDEGGSGLGYMLKCLGLEILEV